MEILRGSPLVTTYGVDGRTYLVGDEHAVEETDLDTYLGINSFADADTEARLALAAFEIPDNAIAPDADELASLLPSDYTGRVASSVGQVGVLFWWVDVGYQPIRLDSGGTIRPEFVWEGHAGVDIRPPLPFPEQPGFIGDSTVINVATPADFKVPTTWDVAIDSTAGGTGDFRLIWVRFNIAYDVRASAPMRRKHPNATGQGVGPTRHWPLTRRGVTGIN